jgi:hypothetical protein
MTKTAKKFQRNLPRIDFPKIIRLSDRKSCTILIRLTRIGDENSDDFKQFAFLLRSTSNEVFWILRQIIPIPCLSVLDKSASEKVLTLPLGLIDVENTSSILQNYSQGLNIIGDHSGERCKGY